MGNDYRFMVDAGLGSVSAVVATLPAAYTLGESRFESGVKYRLVHNAGNSQVGPGFVMTPVLSAGPYSLTITTTSRTNGHLGAGVVVHTTLTTGTFGWVAVRGRVGGLVADTTSVPTGSAVYIAANGQIDLMPQSVITGVQIIGVNLGGAATKTVTTGAKSGDCVVQMVEI